MADKERFLKLEDVENRTGLAKTTIYKRMKDRQFPQRIKLGDRRVVWLESEVNNWMAEQISKNRD